MKFLEKTDKSMRAVTINCEFSLPRLSAGVSNVHEAESTDEEWSKETKDRSLSAVRHFFVHEDVQSWITHTGTVFMIRYSPDSCFSCGSLPLQGYNTRQGTM